MAQMNYPASVTDFFKPQKWMMNLLFGGVCVLIPVIGPIVLKGWLVTGFWAGQDKRPEQFPDFDFNNFTKYLERGLWPFLVTLVATIPISMVIVILIMVLMLFSTLLVPHHGSDSSGLIAVFLFLMTAVLYVVLAVGMMVLLTPLTVRASLTQDFGSAFNFRFIKRFISLTWKESVLASLFLIVASIGLTLAGALALCVGMYFAMGVVYFCGEHLHKQLYWLYLSRGGEPVPVSPKLWEGVPSPPIPSPIV